MAYSRSAPRVLLAVRDVHEEIRAGFGRSLFAVRTLDGVSLSVCAGELVVLRGGVACGAASLVAHLTGTRRIRSGIRIVASGVQIRRACISEDALGALIAGWSAAPAITMPASARHAPVVHVFHVRRMAASTVCAPNVHEQWRAWARALRAQGGGVLVHLPLTKPGDSRPATRDVQPTGYPPAPVTRHRSRSVHESQTADGDTGVRVLTLAAGRIISADNGPIDPLHSS